MKEDKHYLKTLGNTIKILNIYQNHPKAYTIIELMKLSGLDRDTVYRIVYTMTKEGYLVKQDKKYGLSSIFMQLSDAYLKGFNILQTAQDEIDSICHNFGGIVTLYLDRTDKLFMIYYCEPPHTTYPRSQITMPRNCSSVGKVFLSQYSDDEIRAKMAQEGFIRITEKSICEIEPFLEEIHFVRENGYATCNGEFTLDTGAIGVPIFNKSGEIVFAISYTYCLDIPEEKLNEIIPELLAAGKRLSCKLGHFDSLIAD